MLVNIKCITLLAAAVLLSAQPKAKLKIEDVDLLLKMKVPSETIIELAQGHCVGFKIDPQIVSALTGAGASTDLIGALATVKCAADSTPIPRPQQPVIVDDESSAKLLPNPKDQAKYVRVPAGQFMMGCSPGDGSCGKNETPHPVWIKQEFWLGETEVTYAQYAKFATETARPQPLANDLRPMNFVTWTNAAAYCQWIGGRLPTEAEWEYAARAGVQASLPPNPSSQAHYNAGSTIQVRRKQPNAFGLYDMLGNVREWVYDWYAGNYYSQSPGEDPQGASAGTERVDRGGSFGNGPDVLRFSARDKNPPARSFDNIGFRCVWNR